MQLLLLPIEKAGKEICRLHADIMGEARTTIEKAIRIGELLTGVKASLKHGQWLPWVKENLTFSERTAQNYLRCFDKREELKSATVADFGPADAYRLLTEGKEKTAHVSHNSGENEWYTPPPFIEAARAVMGSIQCDPASSKTANKIVKADHFFTKEENGLQKKWNGNVWLNPPYAQPLIDQFSQAVCRKFTDGEIYQAIILVNNATETEWFARMAEIASVICFPSSRIKFLDPEGNQSGAPLQGQAVLYFGKKRKAFIEHYSQMGFVLCKPLEET